MAEMLLSYGNIVETAVLAGGASVPSMPLPNLQDEQLSVKWRSADTALASTQIKATFAKEQVVRVLALAHHNINLDGKIRIRASEDPAFPVASVGIPGSPIGLGLLFTYAATGGAVVHDTGWIDVWPSVYDSLDLEWEADNFWFGKFLEEDIQGYNTYSIIFDQNIRVQNWLIEIDNQTNEDGFVQAGRLFMARSWQPVRNADFGATIGWETNTGMQKAISGAKYFDRQEPYRVAVFKFSNMTEDEGLSGPFEITRKMGIDGEVLYMWDPEDTVHAPRRQFLGNLRELSPLEFPDGFINGNELTGDFRTSMPMAVEERVP